MTHSELSKVLAAALRDCVSTMNNPSMAGDPEKAYRAARAALMQYDNTSQPARRNRREAQRARLCVDAMAGLTDAQVSEFAAHMAHARKFQDDGFTVTLEADYAPFDTARKRLGRPSTPKNWPRPNTGD